MKSAIPLFLLLAACTHAQPGTPERAALDSNQRVLAEIAALDGQAAHYQALADQAQARAAHYRAQPGQEGMAAAAEAEAASYRARKSAVEGEKLRLSVELK